MSEVICEHAKKTTNKHKLPIALIKLIEQTNTTNVVGFGTNKRQQLESLLNNLLQYQDEAFILIFKKELTTYYSELQYNLTKTG